MSKYFEVHDMPDAVPVGGEYGEYGVTGYPKAGMYIRNDNGFFFTGSSVFFLGVIPAGLITEGPEQFATAVAQTGGISENTLLKALAIAQNPALAEKLCL